MKTLTEQEFLDKYGEALVCFRSYYKYSFSFFGEFEGKRIEVSVGGSSDDIYRFEVSHDKKYAIKDLGVGYANVYVGEACIEEYMNAW